MPTESTKVQERVLKAVYDSQEASIEAVRRWSEAVATAVPRLPELFDADRPDQSFGFMTKLWSSQWDYATRLTEAFTAPLVQGARQSSEAAAGQAASAARAATPNQPKT